MFPSGDEGMKRAVEKGKTLGIRIGVHTLTNFINTNDPTCTPVPDDRLSVHRVHHAGTRTSTRSSRGDRGASPEYFANEKDNTLHTVKIGRELVQYRAVSADEAVRCSIVSAARSARRPRRTAPGRRRKALRPPLQGVLPRLRHAARDRDAIWRRSSTRTGVDHIDFDGHEGRWPRGRATTRGRSSPRMFTSHGGSRLINGTSISKTFYWHIASYYNWGEPWYGGFKESMQQYRIDNQALFDRNYMPHMLGWYLLTGDDKLAEMEWMLARAAGFARASRCRHVRGTAEESGTGLLLNAIREWKTADVRRLHAITARTPQDHGTSSTSSLSPRPRRWLRSPRLYPFHDTAAYRHERAVLRPGGPTGATWTVNNPDEAQPLQFRVQALGRSAPRRNWYWTSIARRPWRSTPT